MHRIDVSGPLYLDCQQSGDTVQLIHQTTVLVEPAIELYGTDTSTTLEIRDFEDENGRCRVNVFTIERDGTLTPWERLASGAVSPAVWSIIERGGERAALLVPVPYAPLGELTADLVDQFAPQDYTPSRVRIVLPPPEDDKPPPHDDQ
ncbi:hypothetical protein [Haliangium ochraceum]|uniref:Uncharacterized protein n=1 Tax=Haliangium ochraceum (strain DSM 14365 / JCM 11303 / SMP-2) TaxID=502025 RepID=D0LTI4_HALO1|nr:hypothetical protein [Haliangium ochraceum]ACY13879.1 hypothetical protein Hoch_1321 [Haliangium ochraceum DSM 14365]